MAEVARREIIFNRRGDFAYVANREDDFIATFKVDAASGKLEVVERTTTGGKTPRYITLDPTEGWLLVANQASDRSRFSSATRRQGGWRSGVIFPVSHPQCLIFG